MIEEKVSILERYGENLTAKEYIVDPAIGRDQEIKEAMRIMLLADKSVLLVGKPGIGKTAIVEGIAYRIKTKQCPVILQNKQIIKITISSLTGSLNSGGQTEMRVDMLVKELAEKPDVVVFLDETHLLVNPEGGMDAANMLKTGLDRGTIKIIGATTSEEYETYILRDRAFLRRFEVVNIAEADQDTVVKILMGTLPKLEKRSGARVPYQPFITEKIMRFIVEMTSEFKRVYGISSRYPDICITLVNDALSHAVYHNSQSCTLKYFYMAICNCKSIYEDAKLKEIERFKVVFKDMIASEGVNLNETY